MPDCALHPDYRHCTGRQNAGSTGRLFLVLFLSMIVCGCTGVPEGISPVKAFDLDRYLGTWYEIARLDHSFERGLDDVSAEYSLRDDGGVRVINRGFLVAEETWKEAEGKAYFAGAPDEGYLKVSFFGPFYGSYIVFELDQADYQYAFVAGNSKSYLWFLSRTPTVNAVLLAHFIERAAELGFDTDGLIFVGHRRSGEQHAHNGSG
jgi:apolipoprotein D and lipocalin family protein